MSNNDRMQSRQKIYLFTVQSDRIKYLSSFGINKVDDFDIKFLDEDALSSSTSSHSDCKFDSSKRSLNFTFTEIKQIENETFSE